MISLFLLKRIIFTNLSFGFYTKTVKHTKSTNTNKYLITVTTIYHSLSPINPSTVVGYYQTIYQSINIIARGNGIKAANPVLILD